MTQDQIDSFEELINGAHLIEVTRRLRYELPESEVQAWYKANGMQYEGNASNIQALLDAAGMTRVLACALDKEEHVYILVRMLGICQCCGARY